MYMHIHIYNAHDNVYIYNVYNTRYIFLEFWLYTYTCQTCRLTGRAVFRSLLLGKQGRLIDVPYQMTLDNMTVKQLAEYLEPMLTAAAGGSLDTYRN